MLTHFDRQRIIFGSDLPSGDRLILIVLNNFVDGNGECFPSMDTIAEMSGMTRRGTMKAVNRLLESGIINRADRFDKSGRQTSNLFKVDFEGISPRSPLNGRENSVPGEGELSSRGGRTQFQGRENSVPGGGRTQFQGEGELSSPDLLKGSTKKDQLKGSAKYEKSARGDRANGSDPSLRSYFSLDGSEKNLNPNLDSWIEVSADPAPQQPIPVQPETTGEEDFAPQFSDEEKTEARSPHTNPGMMILSEHPASRFEAGLRGRAEGFPWKGANDDLQAAFRRFYANVSKRKGQTDIQAMAIAVSTIRKANYAVPGQEAYQRVLDAWELFLANAEQSNTVEQALGTRDRLTPAQEEARQRRASERDRRIAAAESLRAAALPFGHCG